MPTKKKPVRLAKKKAGKKKRKSYGIMCRRRYEMYLLKADPTGEKTLDFQEWAAINC